MADVFLIFQVLTILWIFYRFQTAYTPRAAEFMADKPALVSFVEEMGATKMEIIKIPFQTKSSGSRWYPMAMGK